MADAGKETAWLNFLSSSSITQTPIKNTAKSTIMISFCFFFLPFPSPAAYGLAPEQPSVMMGLNFDHSFTVHVYDFNRSTTATTAVDSWHHSSS